MLTINKLSYWVGKKYLLQDISYRFRPGVLNLIIGPNGAGKSTLIKLISGQLPAPAGTILYGDQPIQEISANALAKRRAVLSQQVDLVFPMQMEEVVLMGRYPYFTGQPSSEDYTVCKEVITYFELETLEGRNYNTLSGGEKQRVHFARVLAQIWNKKDAELRYLLLDEPLTFLDIYYQFNFLQKMKELIQQQPLVVVGVIHDLHLAARFAEELVLLKQGSILASGSSQKVLSSDNIYNAFGIEYNPIY
ncbi:MAG: ATP-binding cassette domain-containing protein [Flavihumibacter sp.]|nr:ATP-binding cassette domain-containing protein [Flavihumibacter sp.]